MEDDDEREENVFSSQKEAGNSGHRSCVFVSGQKPGVVPDSC